MNKIYQLLIFALFALVTSFAPFSNDNKVLAQDIPELHMIIFQGDVMLGTSNSKTSALDGLSLEAKIDGVVIGSTSIGNNMTGRYSALEVGPNLSLEGGEISFWVGDQVALEKATFGPLTVSGTYCRGCTWSLPISRVQNLHFNSVPLATPTPSPKVAAPAFLTGTLIFGSVLSAPEGYSLMEAYIDDKKIGSGTVSGSDFSITLDPGTEAYIGKSVIFKVGSYESKTNYLFVADDFQTDFKLFFPEYIPPTLTPTPTPLATAVPTATSTPEPTRTPTPVPEPTPTYTPTATPTPIVVGASSDFMIEDSDGGCNSRGGGPASVGLIILSLAPVYLLNRKRKTK